MVYKLNDEERKEYLDAIDTFVDKVAKVFFRGLGDIIKNPNVKVPITLNSVLSAVDNELLDNVSPKIVRKIDAMLAQDKDLLNKNDAMRVKFDAMTADEKQQAIDEVYAEQVKMLNRTYGTKTVEVKQNDVASELSTLFGNKIDPETMN